MNNREVQKYESFKLQLDKLQPTFEELAEIHGAVNFKAEASFALQLLRSNNYLAEIALKNPQSLQDAVINVAAIGLSLSPAKKEAYLVPRDGKVCLDISYMGMNHLACSTGSILWVKAELVYEGDKYEEGAAGKEPIHIRDPFNENRGNIKGAYCLVKLNNGEFMTTTMTIKEINDIRNRSPYYQKTKKGPWATDYHEMIKKTVIKRASKLWPKVEADHRLAKAVEIDNQNNGINFDSDTIALPTEQRLNELKELVSKIPQGSLGDPEARLLKHLQDRFKRDIESIDDLTAYETEYSLSFLRQFAGNKQ